MTARTRYFVIISLLVLGIGLGTGLVAYYVGFPAGALARAGGPDELRFVPRDATVIAYADVREVMGSDLRRKLHTAVPVPSDGQRDFEDKTGINIETDIDHVVACIGSDLERTTSPGIGMVLARGRFNETKIEQLMRDHGADAVTYHGKRLIAGMTDHGPTDSNQPVAASFLEPGLMAFGSAKMVQEAIDLHQSGDNPQTGLQSVIGNEELMNQVRALETGNVWAVGRFDVLRSKAHLPPELASRIPPITWFSATGHVNGGLRGTLRAETRDEESANNLRDVVKGFLALGKLQAGSRPDVQAMMQSLELGGTGTTVALSFEVPSQIFDAVAAVAGQHHDDLRRSTKPQ